MATNEGILMTEQLAGKAAIVTGGASGIGAALVQALTDAGASVLAVDMAADGLAQISEQTGCATRVADVSTDDENEAIVADALERFGRLDLAFLNAGILGRAREVMGQQYTAADIDLERYKLLRGVNLDAVVYGTVAAAKAMAATGGGAIIATASTAGLTAWHPTPMYTASKHAVVGWVRAMGPALAADGIRINAICPAGVSTPLVGLRPEDAGGSTLAPATVAEAMIDTALGDLVGEAITVVAQRDPIWQPHVFNDVPGFP